MAATPGGYAQIREMLRARVARGELKPGDRLASVRELAAKLGVNVNTVARAYAELAREGTLVTRSGGGTHIADVSEAPLFQQAREERLRELIGSVVLQALGLGYRPEQVEAAVVGQLARWQSASPPAQEGPKLPPKDALVFAGSHDLTLDLLTAGLQRREPPVWLATTYIGSLEGLMALARQEAHLAGCHLIDEESGEYNAPFVKRLLPGQRVALVAVALREQGFMVRPGNPKHIEALRDLARADVTTALRQRGSGTQVLLEHKLREARLGLGMVRANNRAYTTHLAVASAVLEGGADVGLGIRGAARVYGLDFVPLAMERYELVIPERLLGEEPIQALLETLNEVSFRETVRELGGYDISETGGLRWVG